MRFEPSSNNVLVKSDVVGLDVWLDVPEEFYSSRDTAFRATVTTKSSHSIEDAVVQVKGGFWGKIEMYEILALKMGYQKPIPNPKNPHSGHFQRLYPSQQHSLIRISSRTMPYQPHRRRHPKPRRSTRRAPSSTTADDANRRPTTRRIRLPGKRRSMVRQPPYTKSVPTRSRRAAKGNAQRTNDQIHCERVHGTRTMVSSKL